MKNKLLKLSFGFCLVLVAVLTCGLSAVSADDTVVLKFTKDYLFNTSIFYQSLKEALAGTDAVFDKENLTITTTQEQLNKVEVLEKVFVSEDNISEVGLNLGYLKNLKKVSIQAYPGSDGTVKKVDISFISKMTKLTELEIIGEQIGYGNYGECKIDISPIASLVNLESFFTNTSETIDLAIFKNMTNLNELRIYGISDRNIVDTDLSDLSNLTKLKYLSLRNTNIKDISELKNMTELESLSLLCCKVEDISVLKNLNNLKKISLDGNNIMDFSALLEREDFDSLEIVRSSPYGTFVWMDETAFMKEGSLEIAITMCASQWSEVTTSTLEYKLPKLIEQVLSGKLNGNVGINYSDGELAFELPQDTSKGSIRVMGATLSADNKSIVFPADAKDGDVATILVTGGRAFGTEINVTYKPQAEEDKPVVTPPAEEDKPVVTPPAEEDKPVVTPPTEEDKPVVTPPTEEDKPVVTPPTEDDKEEEELPTNTYEYLAGKNQTYIPGETTGLTFKIDADIALFEKVLVDGKELAENLYTAVSGSTVITLNDEYVKTLAEGKHTLSVQFANNKTSDTEFIIASEKVENEPGDYKENPDTGVVKQSIIISVLALVGIALCGTVAYKFKRN